MRLIDSQWPSDNISNFIIRWHRPWLTGPNGNRNARQPNREQKQQNIVHGQTTMATEWIGNQQIPFHRNECQYEQRYFRRYHGQYASANAAPRTNPRKRYGIVILTESIVLHTNNGQIESHEHIGNGQIADDHADGTAFVAMRETTPQHQCIADARQRGHRPCGIAQQWLRQQILQCGHAYGNSKW